MDNYNKVRSVLVVLAFHDYNKVWYLLYSHFTITTRFGTCCTRISRLRQGSLLVVLENDDYNKDRYLLYSCFTITTRFGTCCTRLSRLQQGLVLVVLAFHDYDKVRYLSYSKMTITTRFGTCCTRKWRLQQGSVLVVLVGCFTIITITILDITCHKYVTYRALSLKLLCKKSLHFTRLWPQMMLFLAFLHGVRVERP